MVCYSTKNRETRLWEEHTSDFLHRHAWMSYMVDKSPAADPLLQRQVRVWEPKEHRPTLTWTRSGYKPYNTYVPDCDMGRSGTNRR